MPVGVAFVILFYFLKNYDKLTGEDLGKVNLRNIRKYEEIKRNGTL